MIYIYIYILYVIICIYYRYVSSVNMYEYIIHTVYIYTRIYYV